MEDIKTWHLKLELCEYADRLLSKLTQLNKEVNSPIDIEEIKKAIFYAKKYHGLQKRQSGEPFYSHPLEVAYMVSDHIFKTDIIVTSILHDTIEDTRMTEGMIEMIFGGVVAAQVEELTRVKKDRKISAAEILHLLFQHKKYDLLLIKLFDRLHNIQTIEAKSPEKAKKTIEETLKYFLVLCDVIELPWLCDTLYEKCYIQNIKLGVVTNTDFFLEKSVSTSFPFF